MIRVAVTVEAFEAIVDSMPFGDVSYQRELNAKGECLIGLEPVWVNKLAALRGPGESFSDVIIRLAQEAGRLPMLVSSRAASTTDLSASYPGSAGKSEWISRRVLCVR